MAFLFRSGAYTRAVWARSSARCQQLPTPLYQPSLGSLRFYGAGGELNQESATERVVEVVKKFHKVDPEKVSDKSHFLNDLGLDSLDCVELVMAIEDEFCVEVPDAEQENLVTVDAVIQYVLSNPNAK
mmetsp:Transcript_16767/g.47285  ORF Transcript_16767/g.47285 Transcript_16767/m.47285 type:complete len:128 (+) Transcript_16767:122-505(+)